MHTTHPSPRGTRDTSVAAILEDAALYLDTYGWCQGTELEQVPDALPRACALSAIYAVTEPSYVMHNWPLWTMPPEAGSAVAYLADFLDEGIWRDADTPDEVVWKFNDDENTTKNLVTHALRAAAKRARVELADKAVGS